jgi:hypothetical protein
MTNSLYDSPDDVPVVDSDPRDWNLIRYSGYFLILFSDAVLF